MVHPEGIENLPAIGSEASRKLEHFSFRAEDAEAFNNRILSAGERMRVIDNAEIKTAALIYGIRTATMSTWISHLMAVDCGTVFSGNFVRLDDPAAYSWIRRCENKRHREEICKDFYGLEKR